MLDTSVRLLRLLSLLQTRKNWSGADLASRLDVSTRTVRNDIERLRILGYEVHSRTGIAGGYQLRAGSAMPPLLLDDEEAVAVGVGLRAAASGSVTGIEETSLRALRKLEQTLPRRLRHQLDALRLATVSAAGGGPTVDAETLTTIAGACHDHRQLRFEYQDHDGATTVRRVEPHRLVYTGRRWYLLAWDCDRGDWRTFRADRIRPRPPTGPPFTPRQPPEDAATHVVRGTGSLAWEHQARVILHASAIALADRIPPAAGLLRAVDEHNCVLETGSGSLRDLVGFLTSLDVSFNVQDPPELRALLRQLADRYTAAADDGCSAGLLQQRRDDPDPATYSDGMQTVVLGEPPAPLADWLARRRELGQDLFDEVWEGVHHVAPAPHRRHGDVDDQIAALLRPLARQVGLWPSGPLNVGESDDYRVPDRAYLRDRHMDTFVPTAAVVVEIVSPEDETFAKFPFYVSRGIEELLIVDPQASSVQWYRRDGHGMASVPEGELLGITGADLTASIDWPSVV